MYTNTNMYRDIKLFIFSRNNQVFQIWRFKNVQSEILYEMHNITMHKIFYLLAKCNFLCLCYYDFKVFMICIFNLCVILYYGYVTELD